jgi:hypothetical protein
VYVCVYACEAFCYCMATPLSPIESWGLIFPTASPPKHVQFCRRLFFGRHVHFLGWTSLRDHPPPKPPFQCTHPDRKGTNLLLFKFCIHLHTHQDLKLKCCRVMGQKLGYGRPCTHDLLGTQNWLAQPHIAFISSEFH